MTRGASLAIRAQVIAALVIGCGASGGSPMMGEEDASAAPRPYGSACDTDGECASDAPFCRAPAGSTDTVCTRACSGDAQCPGAGCVDGFCAACRASTPGALPPGDPCACASDCASGAECRSGICTVSGCRTSGCPEGLVCVGEGEAATCLSCLSGDGSGAEDDDCACDPDCGAGLACAWGTCGRACEANGECAGGECEHHADSPSTCGPHVPMCPATGSLTAGQACACNEDCDASAPLCVRTFAGAFCARRCGDEACPAGTACCESGPPGEPTCLPPDVGRDLGWTCS